MNRVLIVDDQDPGRYLLRSLLQGHGFEVEEAHNGAEALACARLNPPRIVVSDLLMPVMDGFTLLRHWKRDEQLKQIPFVVYTATYTDPRDEQLARDLGADAFITKPDEPEPFVVKLRAALARPEASQPATRSEPDREETLLQRYNEVLVRKLGGKLEELERANRALGTELLKRDQNEARIQHQLDELRRWHDAMLDREGRVLELKSEVNELLLKAMQPIRYPSAASQQSPDECPTPP
jgi:two-component system, cell cycle sensor histidine kinase and response regulator CckA